MDIRNKSDDYIIFSISLKQLHCKAVKTVEVCLRR